MRDERPRKQPGLFFGGIPVAEAGGFSVLLIGFLLLLILIGVVGHLARKSFAHVENEIAVLHQAEARELEVILGIGEEAGKMIPEARMVAATDDRSRLLHFPAEQRLRRLKGDMDGIIEQGRRMPISGSEAWKEFESSLDSYWNAIMAGESVQQTWDAERDKLMRSIGHLKDLHRRRHEENDSRSLQLSASAQTKVGALTVLVLLVGVVVAGFALYEVRRVLERLNRAYYTSAEARDYLQSLVNSLVSGLAVLDKSGVVTSVNDAFKRMVGTSPPDPVGKSYQEVFRKDDILVGFVAEKLDGGPLQGRDRCRVELPGRLFDVFASPLIIGENQRGLILIFVDITDVERAQSELRRNRALTAVGQMTTQIAHEIKNPLGSIRFAAEVLKRRLPGDVDQQREVIEIIERSVDHLASIVNELCEFSRPKELNRTQVNLNELLDDLLPMVADRISDKGLSVEKSYTSHLPNGMFDSAELRKLFLNLIINAIDASDEGDSICLRTQVNGSGGISVQIVDQGCGMDLETQSRLFEPFYTTKQKGTGLGMPIAKKIAELHRGDLRVDSREGRGTTVTVRLPTDLSLQEIRLPDN